MTSRWRHTQRSYHDFWKSLLLINICLFSTQPLILSILLTKVHTHTHTQPFNSLWSGTSRVGRYQKKHSPTHTHDPSWSPDILYHLLPFIMITGILFVHFTCLTVLSYNLSPGPLSWTLNFILNTFLHPIIIFFSQHMPIQMQPVLLQYQCYVIYT